MTLTEFLLRRIEEDEQRATAAGHGCGYVFHEHSAGWVEVALPEEHNARPAYEVRQIKAWSPERVKAECKAKRAILKRAHESNGYWGRDIERAMLTPYLDHPDCNHEWWQ